MKTVLQVIEFILTAIMATIMILSTTIGIAVIIKAIIGFTFWKCLLIGNVIFWNIFFICFLGIKINNMDNKNI